MTQSFDEYNNHRDLRKALDGVMAWDAMDDNDRLEILEAVASVEAGVDDLNLRLVRLRADRDYWRDKAEVPHPNDAIKAREPIKHEEWCKCECGAQGGESL